MIPLGRDRGSRGRIVAITVVAVLVLLGAWASQRLKVVTDIRHFIPTDGDAGLAEVSAALAGSPLTRTLVLAVEGPRPVEAAGVLAEKLRDRDDVQWVRTGIDEPLEAALSEIYLPRSFYLAWSDTSEEGLAAAAERLQQTLGGPRGALVRELVPSDPLLSFTAFLDRVRREDGGALTTRDGQLVTRDGTAAILFVRTKSSAFDSRAQSRLQADLAAMMDDVRSEVDPGATLAQSGVARFAITAEQRTIADVTRVSVVSTIGILLLFLVVFGQLRAIVLTYLPVVVGVGGGMLACSLLVEEVHGLTLAFGSALLGVGVDYAVHLMMHIGHRGDTALHDVVRRVRPGVILGAVTTVVGLAGMAFTSFPGMRELALFGAAGIAGSLVVTLLVVPAFGADLPERRLRRLLVGFARRVLSGIATRRAPAWAIAAAVVALGATGLARIEWSDGLSELYQVDPEIAAEDTRVREMTGAIDMSRVVLARGRDLQEALQTDARVHDAVARAAEAGELEGYRSVHAWLPSVAEQRENLERLREPGFRARFDAAFEAAGFRAGVFAPFFDRLEDPPPLLRLEDIEGTALAPLVEPFVIELPEGFAVITWLRGDPPAGLREELAGISGAQLFDQQRFLDAAYGRYRVQMIQMLVVGLAAVLAIIVLRYRRWHPSAAAFLPAVTGVLGALGVIGWSSGAGNLMHAASLLLVCSMGVDYGVFMVESRDDPERDAVTLASAIVAGITTVLSFGALAMSSNPGLSSVGSSVAVGVACALATTPAVATLRKERAR